MINSTPLNEQIATELKKEITLGKFKPGQRIDIEQLANRWNVSTTPIRDALKSLEKAGFVVFEPRKSVMVASFDLKTFTDQFELRRAYECLAVELSIYRIPEKEIADTSIKIKSALAEFKETQENEVLDKVDNLVHKMVLDYCDNELLVEKMKDLTSLISWARRVVIQKPKNYEEAAIEHIQIIEQLKERNMEGAVSAMRQHLINSYERSRACWVEEDPEQD